ncbi:MAG: glycosyltransferase family 10 [Methanomassiliicoccales archaeon]
MYKVKFDSQDLGYPWDRQTPGRSCIWGDFQFIINQEVDECDYWVVEESLSKETSCTCPSNHTVFVTGEPPSNRTYNPVFLHQFQTVISCHKNLIHRKIVNNQPGLPWFIGMRWDKASKGWKKGYSKDFDELMSMPSPEKDKLVSVIMSDKTKMKGQRLRLDFVKRLKKELGEDLDVFITSNMELEDKWDAIGRYRYHIVLENGIHSDFWTEKLADPLLGSCYPIYYGCPNISDYFPNQSYTQIDITDFDEAFSTIKRIIYSDEREMRLYEINSAKQLILNKYNIFPMLADQLGKLPPGNASKKMVIRPEEKIYTHNYKTFFKGVGSVTFRPFIDRIKRI